MKDWTIVKQICIMIMGVSAGLLIGVGLDCEHENTKHYPIEVQTYWAANGYSSYPNMECDSIKGDTLWKDGSKIVNKNIINLIFK
jgi:hypothetical protein